MRFLRITVYSFIFAIGIGSKMAFAERFETSAGVVKVDQVVAGLDAPWAVAILDEDAFLITERSGALLYIKDGNRRTVSGVPTVYDEGQGGLLDLALARDFDQTGEVFITFAEPGGRGGGTALAVAKFDANQAALSNVRIIFSMNEKASGGRHFGSRVVEAQDGTLFLTIGDRGDRASAQDLDRHNGTVIRVNRDGSIPEDNPDLGGAEGIYSYGHRNAQGAALDLRGDLWTVEHGARGGDEINKPRAGLNYGWPIISFGTHYSGLPIGVGTETQGMEQPSMYWDPSIAPSGMIIYSGRMFPEWRGDIFVGSLKFNYMSRIETQGSSAREVEQLFRDDYTRIRDIREGPDGSIYFLSVGEGALFRVLPDG
ncbi:MAG: PQQ-dependent sugar dehydrogenase [Pseudomonadota bacterium]